MLKLVFENQSSVAKNPYFSIIVFIEQCYDCHYFEVHGQWTHVCIRGKQHVANFSHAYCEAGHPLGYWSNLTLTTTPSTVIYGGCRQT